MRVDEPYNAHGLWPSLGQERLLRAALGGEDATRAFEAWHAQADLERLDGGSVRLLPLLYRTLLDQAIPVAPRLLDRVRGVYRQAWLRNQLLLAAVAEVVDSFQRAGIPVVLLKGVPLAIGSYPTIGCRPMTDADVLVPGARARDVLSVARDAGLEPRFGPDAWPPRFTASKAFVHPAGWELDLHVNVMHECRGDERDAAMWARAVPIAVNGVATKTLAPEDHLLHTIAHGVWRNALPPIRWVADAVLVVRKQGEGFAWSCVVQEARERRIAMLAGRALSYLRDRMGLPVPAAVVAALASASPSLAERFEYRARMWSGAPGLAATRVSDYLRARGREPDWQGPLGLVHYVRDTWALPSSWLVPITAWRKARLNFRIPPVPHVRPRPSPRQ